MGGPGGGDGGGGGGGDIDGLDSITSVLTPRNQSMGGKTNRVTLIWRRFRLGACGRAAAAVTTAMVWAPNYINADTPKPVHGREE